jgi:hypothetical protein
MSRTQTFRMRIFGAIPKGHTPLAYCVFIAGFLFYTAVNTTPTAVAMRGRSAPVNADDSFAYLVKAVQMVTCFQQDCPAMEDVRTELNLGLPAKSATGQSSLQVADMRWRMRVTTFVMYHPLHSALVALVRYFKYSWESAFDAVRLAGSLFICGAVAYWLLTLWGPGAAGIALGLLMFFPNQGLHFVVPSNLALAIGMIVWARITAREGAAEWTLVFGSLAMVAMHPVGRLYAIVSVLLFLLLGAGRQWTRSRSIAAILSSFIIGLSFLLPLVMLRPDINIPQRPVMPGATWHAKIRDGLWNNIQEAEVTTKNWLSLYGGLTSAAVLTVMGFFALPVAQRSKVLKTTAVLMGLVLVSIAYILPGYPAELFERVWIPLIIVLTGSAAQVTWDLLTDVFPYLRNFVTRRSSVSAPVEDRGLAFPYFATARLAFTVVLGIFVLVRLEAGIVQGVRTGRELVDGMRDAQRWAFHDVQPQLMLAGGKPGDIVLYLDVVPMHFYWIHGALEKGAIYYPALVDPSTAIVLDKEPHSDSPRIFPKVDIDALPEKQRLTSDKMRYVVGWTPVQQLLQNRDGMVPIFEFSSIDYSSAAEGPLGKGELNIVNPGSPATLHFVYEVQGAMKTADIAVPAACSEWLAVPDEVSRNSSGKFSLNMESSDSKVYLKGIRFGGSALNWPWDQRATLVFNPAKKSAARMAPKTIRFDPEEFLPIRGLESAVRIVNDTGSTVLAELARASVLR